MDKKESGGVKMANREQGVGTREQKNKKEKSEGGGKHIFWKQKLRTSEKLGQWL